MNFFFPMINNHFVSASRNLLGGVVLLFFHSFFPLFLFGQLVNIPEAKLSHEGVPMRSGGSYPESLTLDTYARTDYSQSKVSIPTYPQGSILTRFEGFNFVDNQLQNDNHIFIPPDPIGAAGIDRLIAVVNVMIEARDKTGLLLWQEGLRDFFSDLSVNTYTYDPKVLYDHYQDRFLVVALEKEDAGQNPDPANISKIFLAVSKDGTPESATNADWFYHEIDAKKNIEGKEYFADYPGFELDEEAVYITANMFPFPDAADDNKTRLWIVDKGIATGFYNGQPVSIKDYDPYASGGYATTTMPALVYGPNGAGTGVGTYLVSYNGLTGDNVEYIQVVTVNDPLGIPTFVLNFVSMGDIENLGGNYGFPDLIDAPQLDTDIPIEVNDRRVLDCVWRNNVLWLTTTINPNSGPDSGQTTAHWIKISTVGMPDTTLDQGNIGGEDIAPNTYTYFPSVAVNSSGDVVFGFSASADSIYAGAYVTGRQSGDPPKTVKQSSTVQTGMDYYIRTFGDPVSKPNRWGDYSGTCVDPADENIFWIFNQYAWTRGSVSGGEDGRWGTGWASYTFSPVGISNSEDTAPDRYVLKQNYPNPFNPTTNIEYNLKHSTHVLLRIFNALGEEVNILVDEIKNSGTHKIQWHGTNKKGERVPSGIYLYRIDTDDWKHSQKMVLIK